MARHSTNALTARLCLQRGVPCETVQSWRGTVRHDLFGIADSILLLPEGATWVQNCSYGTLKAHRDAIDASSHLYYLDFHNVPLALWEWRKKKAGKRAMWFLRTQDRVEGEWLPISEWSQPYDLYPTTTRKA